jgi:drug/metabolite transporter (DMT)-like permease
VDAASTRLSQASLLGRLLACSLAWSTGFLFMKLAADVSPFVVSASRAGIATLAIAGWMALSGANPLPKRHEATPWLMLGTLNGWFPNVLTAWALGEITAALGSMIQASGPIMVAVIAHLVFADERLTWRRTAGVLVGFAGMAVLVGPSLLEGGGGTWGVIAMVVVAFSYAVGNIYARTLRDMPASRMALGQQSVSALVSIILSAVFVGAAAGPSMAANAPALLALGVVSTAIPITIFMTLIRSAGATRAAMIGYLLPVWATLLAVIFLGESVGLREAAGGLIILGGVWLVTAAPRG